MSETTVIVTEEKHVRFTAAQYDQAIEALTAGRGQLAPDGDPCHICHDGGHQAWECRFNPLRAMALCRAITQGAQDIHETLHWMAGCDTYMGETMGPAAIVMPGPDGPPEISAPVIWGGKGVSDE